MGIQNDRFDSVTSHSPAVFDLDAEFAKLAAAKCRPARIKVRRATHCQTRNSARRGDVCVMLVTFTDGTGAKTRPVVVLGDQGPDLVVAPMTRHGPRDQFDIQLSPSKRSGLRRQGTVRCSHIASLSRELVLCVVGHVPLEDFSRVLDAATNWFNRIVLTP